MISCGSCLNIMSVVELSQFASYQPSLNFEVQWDKTSQLNQYISVSSVINDHPTINVIWLGRSNRKETKHKLFE